MPPSGYNFKQAQCIQGFLESCSQALESEASTRDELLNDALKREIQDISRYLKTNSVSLIQELVLKLTSDFYESVLVRQPKSTMDYRGAVASVLENIGESILEIHIDLEHAN